MIVVLVHMEEAQRSRLDYWMPGWEGYLRELEPTAVLSFEDEMGLLAELAGLPDVREEWLSGYGPADAAFRGQELIESDSIYTRHTAVPKALVENVGRIRAEGCVLVGGSLADCLKSMWSCVKHLGIEDAVTTGAWYR